MYDFVHLFYVLLDYHGIFLITMRQNSKKVIQSRVIKRQNQKGNVDEQQKLGTIW